jgi:hypothetical protein
MRKIWIEFIFRNTNIRLGKTEILEIFLKGLRKIHLKFTFSIVTRNYAYVFSSSYMGCDSNLDNKANSYEGPKLR